jgi:putative ABC transport system permease protein
MHFSDYVILAFRNIWRAKLRSALTIFAVVIGATSVTIMLALVTGAKSFFLDQVQANGTLQQVAISPQQDITNFNDAQHNSGGNCSTNCTKLTDLVVDKVKAIPHVTGVARVAGQGMLAAIAYGNQNLSLNQTTAYDANGIIVNNVLAGRDIQTSDTTGVLTITSDYADKFGFKGNYGGIIGKSVKLLTQDFYSGVGANIQPPQQCNGPCNGNNQPNNKPTTLTGTIVGVIDTSNNSQSVRIPIEWMREMQENQMYQVTPADQAANAAQQAKCQRIAGPCNITQHMTLTTTDMLAQNGYSSLIAKVDNSKNAASVATAVKKLGLGAADAEASIKQQLTIFNVIGLVLGGIGGIALAVAAVGVVNTMVMAILERTREIGVMRAVGAKRSTVRTLFTIEAALLGFWGGVVGIAVGFGLTRIANIFVNKQLVSQGVKAHDIISLPPWLILAVVGIATLIGMLAGLYPAARAAKLNPVEALRYE